MRRAFKHISLLAILAISASLLIAQTPVTIIFNGSLTDIEGEAVAGEKCFVNITYTGESGDKLHNETTSVVTDDRGSFSLVQNELPLLFKETSSGNTVSIQVEISAAENAEWLNDETFSIKYHLSRTAPEAYEMTRYEGQKLNYTYQGPVWVFSDVYPFGYLKSTFMISLSDEYKDPDKLRIICNKMQGASEDVAPDAPAKRGLKGGYAVGGYQKD